MKTSTFASETVRELNRARETIPAPGVVFDMRQMVRTPSGQYKRGDTRWQSHGSGVVYEPYPGRSLRSYRRLQITNCVRRYAPATQENSVTLITRAQIVRGDVRV